MGDLNYYLNKKSIKNYFFLDRNDGKCYTITNDDSYLDACAVLEKIESPVRFVERVEYLGNWAFIILDRMPAKTRKELLCDTAIKSGITPPKNSIILNKIKARKST